MPLLGLAEILLLVAAVWLTITQFTRTRASSYIERFNSSDALASRVAVDRWLREHGSAKARLEAVQRDPELQTHLRRFTNLFQELGAAYQFRVAHRKTVRVMFDALVVMYWERLRFWIHDYRAQTDPTLYARFEYLYVEITSRQRKERAPAEYVLAYGSLMDATSVSAALGRRVDEAELVPVTLIGWKREWSVAEIVRLGDGTPPTRAVFLDVTPEGGSAIAAVMFRVAPAELERLVARERNYDKRDVRADVRLTGDRAVDARATVWCFTGRENKRIARGTAEAVVLEGYLERVARASRLVDPQIEPELRSAAAASGFPIVSGAYEFVDARQAALV